LALACIITKLYPDIKNASSEKLALLNFLVEAGGDLISIVPKSIKCPVYDGDSQYVVLTISLPMPKIILRIEYKGDGRN